MRASFRLRRHNRSQSADALLVLAHAPADVLAVLGTTPTNLYRTADGWLICSPLATEPVRPMIRLRQIQPHWYVPVDADLEPALHPEEAAALANGQGVIVLPGTITPRVLTYDASAPVPLSQVVTFPVRHNCDWHPLPIPVPLADRLQRLTRETLDESPEGLLEVGRGSIGEQPLTLPPTRLVDQASSRLQLGMGRVFSWLGRTLHWRGMQERGKQLMRQALEGVPGVE